MEFKKGDRIESLIDEIVDNWYGGGILLFSEGGKGTIIEIYENSLLVKFDEGVGDGEWRISQQNVKIIKEEVNMKTKTFKEVIRDIKKGEVWESANKKIFLNPLNQIKIESKDYDENVMIFDDSIMYTLKRKEYNTVEALKAYMEGKEVQSNESTLIYKKIDGKDYYRGQHEDETGWTENLTIDIAEINNVWYIND